MIFRYEREKLQAILDEIKEVNATRAADPGRHDVDREVGRACRTCSSDSGSRIEVLNAKYHEREAEIVAQAGRHGGVTIATNMAGRGTDIILGGNPEFMAWADLKRMIDEDGRPLYPPGSKSPKRYGNRPWPGTSRR